MKRILINRKNDLVVLISSLLFFGSILLLFGIAGSLECDRITIGQAISKGLICIIVLAADALWVTYLGWKEGGNEIHM